ncbi:hypothetical protein BH20ACT15_BH20ACT15_08380 [soil metagenome]
MSSKLTRAAAAAVIAAVAALAAVGCGTEKEGTPSACKTSSADYVRMLASAPEGVAFDDGTTISDCLVPEQSGGELAEVGKEMIAAATTLNAQARKEPTSLAAVQLGYLVGAVENGSEGIHADLVRRLNAAARFNPNGDLLPAAFERTFGQGYAAGLETG